MSHRWISLFTVLALACKGDDKGTDSACIEGAAEPSVQVVVTDAGGAPLDGATVTWSNGGEAQDCDQVGTQFLCGFDNTGTITVTGEAPGYTAMSTDVVVESDGCHAITELVTLRLE